jgi:lipoteichoic acid synthase
MRAGLQLMGVTPGPFMVLFSFGTVLAISIWFRASRPQRQIWAILILQLFVALVTWINVLYYRRFDDLVSIASARFILQLGDVGGNVTELFRATDVKLWLGVLLTLPLLFLPTAWKERLFQAQPLKWRALIALLTVAALVTGLTKSSVLVAKFSGHTYLMSQVGALGYHSVDIINYTERLTNRLRPTGPQVEKVQSWFGQRPPVTSPLAGQYKGKNVIVVQLESFQQFPLGMKVGGEEVTPTMNRLAQESLAYGNFWSQTGQGVTADADLMANCSLYPSRTGAVYYDFASNDWRCTPQLLKEEGYHTAAFQGIRPDFWNLADVYPRIGFDRYYSLKDYDPKPDEMILIGLSDEVFFKKTVDKLKALPQPYYAFAVSLTSHGPFNVTHAPKTLKDLGALTDSHAGNYLQAIHYTDAALGHFIDGLKAAGILDNSILLVYGDHMGVYRQDPGIAAMMGVTDQHDDATWLPFERRVPMLIRLPHGEHAGAQTQIASQVDIGPTVLDLLGVHPRGAYQMGSSMIAADRSKVVALPPGSGSDGTHIFVADASPQRSCYAVATGQVVDSAECDGLRDRVAAELDVSRTIVEHNLLGKMIP